MQEFIAVDLDDAFGSFHNVVTMITVFRELHIHTKLFQITGIDRSSQIIDLIAGIIDIVFTGNIIACRFQKIGK